MKQIILLLLCFVPAIVTAQSKREFSEEEILKDKDYIALQSQIKPIEEKMNAIIAESRQATATRKNDPAYQEAIEKRYSDAVNEVTSILKSKAKVIQLTNITHL